MIYVHLMIHIKRTCTLEGILAQNLLAQYQNLLAQHYSLLDQHQNLLVQHHNLLTQHYNLLVQHQNLLTQHHTGICYKKKNLYSRYTSKGPGVRDPNWCR